MISTYVPFGIVGAVILYVAARKVARRIKKNTQRKMGACWSVGFARLAHPFRFDFSETIPTYDKFQINEPTETIADPFLIRGGGDLYMFHEIVFRGAKHGKIGVAVFDSEKFRWVYLGVAIDEPFHLSYPYVFHVNGRYYMVPESKASQSVRLYTATEFPLKWQLVKTIIENRKLVDPSIVCFKGTYYLFVNRKRKLSLYYADDIEGEWKLHPRSPIRRWNFARCAGRIILWNGDLYRPAQEQSKGYGNSMRIFRIEKLSKREYKEVPISRNDFLHPFGRTWARFGMHHFDVVEEAGDSYFAVFDGKGVPMPPGNPQVNQTTFS